MPELETAAQSLQRYTEEFDRIPTPRIGIVANALNSSRGMLDRANYYMQAAVDEYIPNLPTWLGYEGKQTYAILAMTPGEMRASGGLIGAVGTVTITDGKIEIGDFEANTKFAGDNITARNLSEDENRIYREEGPMSLNYDVRDIANSPDTVRVADYFRAIWDQTEIGKDTELNGVVLADPLMVQSLVKVLGDVTLPNGTVLTGTNTADFLINTAYKDYPAEETDAMFGTVAKACVQRLMGDLDAGKMAKLASEMLTLAHNRHLAVYSFDPTMQQIFWDFGLTPTFPLDEAKGKMAKLASEMLTLAHNRHLAVYSFDPTMQQIFWDFGLTPTFPLDEAKPEIGIYITENNPSKMGWYIKRSTKITQLDCLEDGPAKYHVEYTIRNTEHDDR